MSSDISARLITALTRRAYASNLRWALEALPTTRAVREDAYRLHNDLDQEVRLLTTVAEAEDINTDALISTALRIIHTETAPCNPPRS